MIDFTLHSSILNLLKYEQNLDTQDIVIKTISYYPDCCKALKELEYANKIKRIRLESKHKTVWRLNDD